MIDVAKDVFRQDRNAPDRNQAAHAGRLGVIELGGSINVTIAVL
jgi:hypothetical protein